MREDVLRRFRVHVAGPTLDDVENALRAAIKERERTQPGQTRVLEVRRVERPLMLEVQLRGAAPALSRVVATVASVPGARILRDLVGLPADAQRGGVYPDPEPLLRMSAEPDPLTERAPPAARPVTVAIVDSGIAVDHPDLKDHLWTGTVAGRRVHGARRIGEKRDHDVADEDGHGTLLAGTILATARRAPTVQLMAVKFFDGATRPAAANAARAIDFAIDHGADIIDLSWDLGIDAPEVRRAIQGACAAGKLVVIAAGNDGSNNDRFPSVPACYAAECPESALTVMATNRYDERAWFSNYGDLSVDLAAPGVGSVSTYPFLSNASEARRYHRYSGTSAASAHVTGAAALVMSRAPHLTAKELKARLVGSVDPLPDLRCRSGGRLRLD